MKKIIFVFMLTLCIAAWEDEAMSETCGNICNNQQYCGAKLTEDCGNYVGSKQYVAISCPTGQPTGTDDNGSTHYYYYTCACNTNNTYPYKKYFTQDIQLNKNGELCYYVPSGASGYYPSPTGRVYYAQPLGGSH